MAGTRRRRIAPRLVAARGFGIRAADDGKNAGCRHRDRRRLCDILPNDGLHGHFARHGQRTIGRGNAGSPVRRKKNKAYADTATSATTAQSTIGTLDLVIFIDIWVRIRSVYSIGWLNRTQLSVPLSPKVAIIKFVDTIRRFPPVVDTPL